MARRAIEAYRSRQYESARDPIDKDRRDAGMRQLGDFAAWLGLILLVLGVVYYAPKLVEYISTDDLAGGTRPALVARPPGHYPGNRNRHMAMNHDWASPRAQTTAR
jgi:hypothetical protein